MKKINLQVQTLGFWALTICPLPETSVATLAPIPTWVREHALKKNKLQKGVVGVTWSTHASSIFLTRFPAMILIDHHDSIGDNWPWASFGDFWHWKQNGSHLWDRIQHLLLVNTIEMGNNDADAKKNVLKLEPCMTCPIVPVSLTKCVMVTNPSENILLIKDTTW